jgi:uncharacterized protein (DUF2141 family)
MSLILRKDLTRPLTHEELDGNFVYLNIKYWEKKSYERGEFVLRDVNSGTTLYFCEKTHSQYEYNTFGGGSFIAEYTDGAQLVILWKVVGGSGSGSGVGTITGGTNLTGTTYPAPNQDLYTSVFFNVDANKLAFKTLSSPDGSINITNDNGTIYFSVPFTPYTPVDVYNISTTGVTCFGGANGAISISVSGGTGNYKFTKDSGTNWTEFFSGTTVTYLFTGLTVGSYGVGVFDETLGAQAYQTKSITGNTDIIITKINEVQPITSGATNGSLLFNVSGGTSPYDYIFSGSTTVTGTTSSSISITGLSASTYTLNITDNLDCTKTFSGNLVAQNLTMSSVTGTPTDPLCSGETGKILVTIANGSGLYEYSLNGGVTYIVPPTGNPFIIESGTTAGSYDLVVKDISDNTIVSGGTITISNPTPLTLTGSPIYTSGTCGSSATVVFGFSNNNGTINLSASGGIVSGTNPKTVTFTAPYSGSTTFNWWDSCGVTGTTGLTIVAPGGLVYELNEPTTTPQCPGEYWEYTPTVSGGIPPYEYQLDTNAWTGYTTGTPISITVTGSSMGSTTTLKFRDSGGCTGATLIPKNSIVTPLSVITGKTNSICSGLFGSITLTISGGTVDSGAGVTPNLYQYQILSGTTSTMTFTGSSYTDVPFTLATISSLSSGFYAFNVRRSTATGCTPTYVSPIEITTSTSISGSVIGSTGVTSCEINNGMILVNVTGGTSPYSISINSGITYAYTGITSGSMPYLITGLSASLYGIMIKDSNNCPMVNSTIPVLISGATNPSISGVHTPAPCGVGDDSVLLTVSGGVAPYEYYSGTTLITGTSSTTYTHYFDPTAGSSTSLGISYTVVDDNGCSGTTLVPILSTVEPLVVTATTSGTTLIASVVSGAYTLPLTYQLYSGTSSGFNTAIGTAIVSSIFHSFTGLTVFGQYFVRVSSGGCAANTNDVIIPEPVLLYYGYYRIGIGANTTPTPPIIYRRTSNQLPSGAFDFILENTFYDELTNTSGRTINDVVNYMVTQDNLLGGVNSPIDLSIVRPGGFNPANPLTLPLNDVMFSFSGTPLNINIYLYVLVQNTPPWNINLASNIAADNRFYNSGGAIITNSLKYTGGTSIIISGKPYILYRIGSSPITLRNTSINIR